jgi:hypothetical protein
MEVIVQYHVLTALPLEETPILIKEEFGSRPELVWTKSKREQSLAFVGFEPRIIQLVTQSLQ